MSRHPAAGGSDPIESQLRRDLVQAFRTQLRTDARLVLLGHFLVLILVVISLWENAPLSWLAWWGAAIVLTTLARAAWHRVADHSALPGRALYAGTRTAVLLQGLAWGIGAAALIPLMQGNDLAVILLGFAGIVASAVGTLVADRASLGCFVAGLYLPLLIRWLTPSGDHHDLESAAFVAVFAVAALVLHRRAHRTLTADLRSTARLAASQQETVRESAYLSGVLRGAPIAIAVLDDAKRVRSVNARFERLFGYSSTEAAGHRLDLLLVPQDGRARHLALEQRVKLGEVIGEEVERRTRDGRHITVRVSAALVPDPVSPGMVVLYEDITEQRQAQEALRESEARCRGVVDGNIAGFCFWEREGRITEANDELLRIIGYGREALARGELSWEALCPPDQAPLLLPALAGLAAGRPITPFVLDLCHREGTRAPVMFGAALLADRVSHGVAFVVDISARQRAEVELQQKTAVLEAQLEASLDGILIVDANGRTVLSNRRMAEVWGIPKEFLDDPDDSRRLQFVVQQARHSEDFRARVEYLYAHPTETSREEIELRDGRILDRYSAPVIGHRGEYHGRIWNFRDVTEARRAQLAMRNARDLAERTAETRTRFLANMSHEIRTPMNAVLGLIEIVLDTNLTEEQRRALGLASASADSLLAIINDVLDFSKIEAGRLELEEVPFSPAHLVQATTAMLALRAEQKGLALVTHLAPDLPATVRGDPSRLRQILTNLVGNAIKFTERGGVTVRVCPSMLKDGRAGVWFSVQDTGVGIPPEKLSAIFEEFTQADGSSSRRFGGTGLGLTISQQLATLMGGSILVTSEVGRGSEFSVLLPLATAAGGRGGAAAVGRPQPAAEGPKLLRVLLAEDNAVNQLVAATMLRKRGHQVDLVANGRDAVAAVRRTAYDVVLMDIQMPEMDGFEATAAIRALPDGRDLPIIALTAHAFSEERERCFAAGMTGFLPKPFRSADLLATVEGARASIGSGGEPGAAPPAVDLDSLHRQLSDAGAEAALDDIVDAFLDSVPERVQALEAALASGVAPEIAFAAHALKSSAGTIGAASLAALLAEIEAAARANALTDTATLASRVHAGAASVLADLRVYRGRAA